MACRQLGFISSKASAQQFAFGSGTGQIWLDNVQCRGGESRLVDCVHNGFGEHNCFHFEDAGITCPPGKLSNLISVIIMTECNRCYTVPSWYPSSC